LPSSEAPAAVPATPTATANKKPDNASSPPRWHGIVWGALAVVLYLAIADAAVETFLRDSLLRWWIAGAAVLYLALCAAVWRLMPKLWRRLNWANQAGLSLLVLLALMSATVWMPGGLEQGLNLIGQPTSIVLALVTAVVVALSGIFLARLRFVPLAGKIVAGLLAAYGVAAFLLAVNAGTPYPSLFHGASQWTRLPFWLQGATVGALFLVPLALLLEIVTGLRQITRDKMSDFAFKVIALGMSLVITVAAVRMPADSATGSAADYDSGAVETPPWLSESHEKPLQGEAGYKQASEKLNRLYAGLDVVNSKIDRSLFEIDALADRLGSDPAAMFHFVRDEIRYEPYTGVLRGALGTLLCRAGNSLDRSLLLAALLQKAGFKTQIASGQLNAQQAQILVSRLFEPFKPVPSAAPSLAELASDVGRAMGVDQAKLLRLSDEMQKYGQRQNKQLIDYVDHESSYLSNLLSNGGVDAGVITSNDQLLAEASVHYWVQYQNPSGQWVDLDSAFSDAEPGKANTQVANTFAPDSVPEELYHHLRITLTLRVAQVTDGKDDTTTDTLLLDQELRVADQQDKDIVVANFPQPMPDLTKPMGNLSDVLAVTKGYQTVLQVGSQATAGKYFDLDGKISDKLGGPVGDVVTNAGGIGGAFGGLGGSAGGALGGASQSSTTRIVGEWAEYRLTSPGDAGASPAVRNFRRDIVAPSVVQSWSASSSDNPQTTPTKVGKDALRECLFWSAELLPVPGAIAVDYSGYLALKSFSENRASVDAMAKTAFGTNSGNPVSPSSRPPVTNLLLAEGATLLTNNIVRTRFPILRSYFGRPGLVAYETATDDTSNRFKMGYDIIAFSPRITGNEMSSSGEIHQEASSLHVLSGVLATRLEWALTANASHDSTMDLPSFNATRVFAAAKEGGISEVVLKPGTSGLAKLANTSLPESVKAELSATLATGDDVVVPVRPVLLDGRQQVAWWRFEPASGQAIGVMPGGRGQGMEEYIDLVTFIGAEGLCFYSYSGSDKGVGAFTNLLICSAGSGAFLEAGFLGFEVNKGYDLCFAAWMLLQD
jgi:transglutaminase-like putative cysteine protease